MNEAGEVVLDGGPTVLALPATASGSLAVTLRAGPTTIAWWRFEANTFGPRRLWLSAAALDERFVLLDQLGAPPIAAECWVEPYPSWDGPLTLEVTSGAHAQRHLLTFEDAERRRGTLEAWSRHQVPAIDWFYVEITTACNLKCPFCPSKDLARARRFMTLDVARTVLGKIGEYVARKDETSGYVLLKNLVFLHVMGEPTLHPELTEIVRIARAAGLAPALITNVTRLDDEITSRLLDAEIAHLTLSINVSTEAGHEQLGAKGSLEDQERRALAFLLARHERGTQRPHVDVQYMARWGDQPVAGTGFLGSREEVWRLYLRWLQKVRALGPAVGAGLPPRAHAATLADPARGFGDDPSTRLPLGDGVDLVIKSGCSFGNTMLPQGYLVTPATRGACPFHNERRQMAVFVDGGTSFCNLDHENSISLGSLLEHSVEEIWTGRRMQRVRWEMSRSRLSEPLCQRCLGAVVRISDAMARLPSKVIA